MTGIREQDILSRDEGIYIIKDKGHLQQVEKAQREIYDERKEVYQTYSAASYPDAHGYQTVLLTHREHHRYLKGLQLQAGMKVLDIGCNVGELLHLLNASQNIEGYGIDISIEALKTAQLHCPESFKFLYGSVEKGLPFEDDVFDAITCMDVIEHLAEPQVLIDEVFRVLKPGGQFLFHIPVTDWDFSFEWYHEKLRPAVVQKIMDDAGHFLDIMKTKKELDQMIKSSGFENVRAHRFNAFFQTIFDYHVTHRVLNRLFYVRKVPFKVFHQFFAPVIELFFLLPDRVIQGADVGASVYFTGRKPPSTV